MTVTQERVPMFASMGLRNYRLFWTGGFISNIGTWMSRIAQDWLVLTILTDHSAIALGIVTGLQFLPILLFGPLGGAVLELEGLVVDGNGQVGGRCGVRLCRLAFHRRAQNQE